MAISSIFGLLGRWQASQGWRGAWYSDGLVFTKGCGRKLGPKLGWNMNLQPSDVCAGVIWNFISEPWRTNFSRRTISCYFNHSLNLYFAVPISSFKCDIQYRIISFIFPVNDMEPYYLYLSISNDAFVQCHSAHNYRLISFLLSSFS